VQAWGSTVSGPKTVVFFHAHPDDEAIFTGGTMASQIPETTSALQIGLEQFAAVYGWEWFVRRGPAGAIDDVVG